MGLVMLCSLICAAAPRDSSLPSLSAWTTAIASALGPPTPGSHSYCPLQSGLLTEATGPCGPPSQSTSTHSPLWLPPGPVNCPHLHPTVCPLPLLPKLQPRQPVTRCSASRPWHCLWPLLKCPALPPWLAPQHNSAQKSPSLTTRCPLAVHSVPYP